MWWDHTRYCRRVVPTYQHPRDTATRQAHSSFLSSCTALVTPGTFSRFTSDVSGQSDWQEHADGAREGLVVDDEGYMRVVREESGVRGWQF